MQPKRVLSMEKYRIIIATRVKKQLLNHILFLSKVSIPAAKRMRNSFEEVLVRLKDNPFQFPLDQTFAKLGLSYRKALFDKRYKVLFLVEDDTVYIDSVIDCRQQTSFPDKKDTH